jgi:proline iminopeptidase
MRVVVRQELQAEDGYLDVGNGHSLYWKKFGNKSGLPVVLLHGGPGLGMDEYLATYFDLEKTNLLMFDQRGAGKSLPIGCLEENTTPALIEDCARMMDYHGIDYAVIVGGSWGATLAIEFAKKYRTRCSRLILYSTFLGRSQDEAWFLNGAQIFFPDYWKRFTDGFSDAEVLNIAEAYQARLNTVSPEQGRVLAAQFLTYVGRLSLLSVEEEGTPVSPSCVTEGETNFLKLFLHYSTNEYFLSTQGALQNIDLLRGLPGAIIHGRYDMDSPIMGAYALACAWPDASLHVVPGCGHSDREPKMRDTLSSLFHDLVGIQA